MCVCVLLFSTCKVSIASLKKKKLEKKNDREEIYSCLLLTRLVILKADMSSTFTLFFPSKVAVLSKVNPS